MRNNFLLVFRLRMNELNVSKIYANQLVFCGKKVSKSFSLPKHFLTKINNPIATKVKEMQMFYVAW